MSADQPTEYQIERPGARTITLKLTPGAALDWERAGNTVTPVDELAGPQYHGTTAQEVATIPASDGTDIQVPTTSDVPTPPQAQDAPDAVPDPAPARGRRKPKPAAPVEDVPVEDTDW